MKNRRKKAIKFAYKKFKGEEYPIISVILKGHKEPFTTEAFVDSGASLSIFSAAIASELGINYSKGRMSYTLVGDGSYIPVYLHTISVKLGYHTFRTEIGFSAQLGAEINLLGHNIFERFIITFHASRKTITFIPVKH